VGDDSEKTQSTLFQEAMADVNRQSKVYKNDKINPLRKKAAVDRPIQKTIPPLTISSEQTNHLVDDTFSTESVQFARSGLQTKILKKLKKGEYPFQNELDLHGLRSHEAESELESFLSTSIHQKLSCVLIIHGKGYRSEDKKGVLKPLTLQRLKQFMEVKAFASALPKHGGTGAVYVLLKS
jgi:DNA-nicking Smr family endonuclease